MGVSGGRTLDKWVGLAFTPSRKESVTNTGWSCSVCRDVLKKAEIIRLRALVRDSVLAHLGIKTVPSG